ncbi:hypothetical protein KKG46_02560 [Patescibacteria group bacterium]|nr:hypothetical protein [Patescibacteria group bacterium]
MDIEKELLKETHSNQDNQLDDSFKTIERDPKSIRKYHVDAHGNVIIDHRDALESNIANQHNK